MQQKQNCGHPLRRKGSISRVSKVTCGLLFCLTTGVFAAGENVELLTSDRIENAVPDQVGKTVTIMVQDEMGPVAGANVVVKGTTNGNISDMDGKVVLQNVPNNSTLVISFIGYTTQEVKVSNQATIHVKLVEDAKALEEVVVIGYGSLDKKQVTSAITSLKADDLMVGVSGADISASLQGKIGGLVMNNLGSANSGTTFQLRGMTSINSGKAPLIVIDGFPGGDIRSLTQDDIKSIDVLKDASAGAIYGTRAAAGVILITTKSGSDTNGKVRLTYSNEFTKKQNYNDENMKTIIDKLLALYPECKIVLHRPVWYSPNTYNGAKYLEEGLNRLQSYYPELQALVLDYSKHFPGQVFMGDTDGFDYFKTHYKNELFPEKGNAGTFYLHPNRKGASALGELWGKAILGAIDN